MYYEGNKHIYMLRSEVCTTNGQYLIYYEFSRYDCWDVCSCWSMYHTVYTCKAWVLNESVCVPSGCTFVRRLCCTRHTHTVYLVCATLCEHSGHASTWTLSHTTHTSDLSQVYVRRKENGPPVVEHSDRTSLEQQWEVLLTNRCISAPAALQYTDTHKLSETASPFAGQSNHVLVVLKGQYRVVQGWWAYNMAYGLSIGKPVHIPHVSSVKSITVRDKNTFPQDPLNLKLNCA